MRTRTLTLLALAAALVVGCKSSKSSNPLSPSVAGPIAGVAITAPKPVVPNAGASIDVSSQPVTLVLENASTSGQRPLNYLFEVAIDAGFANKVFSREGITPGGDGKTSFKLPEALAAERTYYWRARAQDGANTGPYSASVSFTVVTPVVFQAPQLQSPVGDVRIASRTPTFKVSNVARTGPVTSVNYVLQLATDQGFSQVVSVLKQAEQPGSTQLVYSSDLVYNVRYFWRVHAEEPSKGVVGPWSSTGTFFTPLPPVTPPDPPTPPPPGGYPSNGPDLVKYITAKYPSYLAAGVSSSQRKANMAFLRDRTIEAGNCGGMQLAWNYKRGVVGDLSIDYITYKKDGRWIGVDIASDYDNTANALHLYWGESPDDPYATYGGYTNAYSCQ